jgi:hypothetical protein
VYHATIAPIPRPRAQPGRWRRYAPSARPRSSPGVQSQLGFHWNLHEHVLLAVQHALAPLEQDGQAAGSHGGTTQDSPTLMNPSLQTKSHAPALQTAEPFTGTTHPSQSSSTEVQPVSGSTTTHVPPHRFWPGTQLLGLASSVPLPPTLLPPTLPPLAPAPLASLPEPSPATPTPEPPALTLPVPIPPEPPVRESRAPVPVVSAPAPPPAVPLPKRSPLSPELPQAGIQRSKVKAATRDSKQAT